MPPDNTPTAVVPESRSPVLGELFDQHGLTIFRKLRVALPARVESYDASKQTVSVKPLLQEVNDNEDGSQNMESLPVISNVPVVFPGAGGFRITFPIKSGDIVLLVFGDRSLDIWKSKGGEVDPILQQRHHISDAVAIIGLHDLISVWTGASTSNMTLGKDGGAQVEITPSEIHLGVSASTKLARDGDTVNKATTMSTWIHAVQLLLNGAGQPVVKGPLVEPTDFGIVSGSSTHKST